MAKEENIDNQHLKTKRELTIERMRARHPEDNFDDEEVLFERINGDYDDYDDRLKERDEAIAKYRQDEKSLSDMFMSDPRAAHFMEAWKKGDDPRIALIREFGEDVRDILDDPARQEEIAELNREFAAKVARNRELEKEYQANLEQSLAYLDKLHDEDGMSDDEIDAVMTLVMSIVRDGMMGRFTPETIELARKAANYDNDVANAQEDGVIRGRNERIEEKLRKRRQGDGVAALGGTGGAPEPRKMPDLGALDRFGDSDDIWKRGGEKRTQHRR